MASRWSRSAAKGRCEEDGAKEEGDDNGRYENEDYSTSKAAIVNSSAGQERIADGGLRRIALIAK